MSRLPAGAALLTRLAARRSRWAVLGWVLAGLLLFVSTAASVDGLYVTRADYEAAAATLSGNAALLAMAGPARALDTLGGQVAWQTTAFGGLVAGLMSMVLVVRHTRADEESGRAELVRAGAVDRHSPLLAAALVAGAADLLLGVVVAGAMAAYPGLALADSVALGLGLTALGWVYVGAALVAAQLAGTTRAAYGLTGAFLGVTYATRGIGDVQGSFVSWLSPMGWYQAMHHYSGLQWWPALLLLVGAVLLAGASVALLARRDVGSGLLGGRPGPARAGASLRGPVGLAWRLQRASVLGWSAGLLFTGLSYGSIGDQVGDVVGGSTATRELFAAGGADLVDGFFGFAGIAMALLAAGFAVSSALRPGAEEDAGHVELLLSAPLPRSRWLAAQVVVTVVGTLVVLLAAALGLWLGYVGVTGEPADAWRYARPVLGHGPAVLVLSGAARLVLGLAPRRRALAWVPVGLAALVVLLGDLLRLPQGLQDLSPFEASPAVPAQAFSVTVFAALLAVAALLSGLGQLAFRRRDVG